MRAPSNAAEVACGFGCVGALGAGGASTAIRTYCSKSRALTPDLRLFLEAGGLDDPATKKTAQVSWWNETCAVAHSYEGRERSRRAAHRVIAIRRNGNKVDGWPRWWVSAHPPPPPPLPPPWPNGWFGGSEGDGLGPGFAGGLGEGGGPGTGGTGLGDGFGWLMGGGGDGGVFPPEPAGTSKVRSNSS